MNLLESGPITLSNAPTNTQSIYVKVVLTDSNEGTYKSDGISTAFDNQTATVSDTVTFAKMV